MSSRNRGRSDRSGAVVAAEAAAASFLPPPPCCRKTRTEVLPWVLAGVDTAEVPLFLLPASPPKSRTISVVRSMVMNPRFPNQTRKPGGRNGTVDSIWELSWETIDTQCPPTWRANCRRYDPGGQDRRLVNLYYCVIPTPRRVRDGHKGLSWFGQERALRPAGEDVLYYLAPKCSYRGEYKLVGSCLVWFGCLSSSSIELPLSLSRRPLL